MTAASETSGITPPSNTRFSLAEVIIWVSLIAGLVLHAAFSARFFASDVSAAGYPLWGVLALLLLIVAAVTRVFSQGTFMGKDSPALRWGMLGAALGLDVLVLAIGESQNGAMRTFASGFIHAGFWSVLLMTVSIGLFLGKSEPRKTESITCLAALLLHTFLLIRQPHLFAVILQWTTLVILAFFSVPRHPLRRFLWGGAVVLGGLFVWSVVSQPHRLRLLLAWLTPETDRFGSGGFHILKLREAFQTAEAFGLDGRILSDMVHSLPGGAVKNPYAVLCLWQGMVGGFLYLFVIAAFLGAMGWCVKSLKSTPIRLALTGAVIMMVLSQVPIVAWQLGLGPPVMGFGLIFLDGGQLQTAITAMWWIVILSLGFKAVDASGN